jgi:hypothetical protein
MLGGMAVWALHFAGVYAIASIADVMDEADARLARGIIGAFSLICFAAAAGFGLAALRSRRSGDDPMRRLVSTVGAVGGGIAAVAVAWQTLPALVGH